MLCTLVFTATVAAYDSCWFFGDDFGSRTFEQYFQAKRAKEYNGYVKAHFDTYGFFPNPFTSDNPSMISRYSNLVSQAVQRNHVDKRLYPFPKLIVVVPDNDLIKDFADQHKGVSKLLTRILNYIMTEHSRAILAYKEHLPAKCLRPGFPHILWIHAPLHDNFSDNSQRYKFNKSLDEVSKMHKDVSALMLKKVWDPTDDSLFLQHSRRYSTDGLNSYWEAVDHTVHYCDSIMLKKLQSVGRKAPKNNTATDLKSDQKDRFKWKNPKYNDIFTERRPVFKKLPSPP